MGKEAITRQGLVYYIDSSYDSDGTNGRVTLQIGVDPQKLEAMRSLMEEMLRGLQASPPTDTEIAEAKQHLLGRRQSAAQSNQEISTAMAREWHAQGRLLSIDEFEATIDAVTRAKVLEIIPDFIAGGIIEVRARR